MIPRGIYSLGLGTDTLYFGRGEGQDRGQEGQPMKVSRATLILRSILGLIFLVFGLNHFLVFFQPPPMQGPAGAFVGALAASGYMLPLLCGVEALAGAMLLAGMLAPLALVMLAPIIVNIVAFHVFLAPSGLPAAAVVAVLELILAWQYRGAFSPLFATKLPA
jgi:uncharacterized membrane protein YphA (DoxX/SURF4 family)